MTENLPSTDVQNALQVPTKWIPTQIPEAFKITAGNLILSDEEKKVLYREIEETDVEIRPDGLIYLPWMEYATRLREAFGGSWAMVPHSEPKREGDLILWGFFLYIKGQFAGYSIGEQEHREGNKAMSWGDACEAAKSNALMRLCKGMGIGLELWKPSFINAWKKEYAETYEHYNERKQKKQILWRKKAVEPEPEVTPEDNKEEPLDITGDDVVEGEFTEVNSDEVVAGEDLKEEIKDDYEGVEIQSSSGVMTAEERAYVDFITTWKAKSPQGDILEKTLESLNKVEKGWSYQKWDDIKLKTHRRKFMKELKRRVETLLGKGGRDV